MIGIRCGGESPIDDAIIYLFPHVRVDASLYLAIVRFSAFKHTYVRSVYSIRERICP